MNIEPFSLDVVNKYNMFFMLQKLNATSTIDLYYQEVNNNVPFEDCALFEMLNGQVLVAFPEYFTHISKHNLIATDGTTSEVVSLQIFERIYKYYKHGVDGVDNGSFVFMNSAIVPSFDSQWRCDAGLYGVEFFADPLGDSTINVPNTADALLVYEPILSINGVAHLVYVERQNKTNKEQFLNNSITPFGTYSLGEALKLILEWAQVSQAPFSNTEPVSAKAFEFTQQLEIEQTLVSNQPDMQIFEYLKGNPTARVRPENVQPISPATDVFIKKNVAHSCLSSLLSIYPDAANITAVKQVEQQKLLKNIENLWLMSALSDEPNTVDRVYYLKSRTELFTIKQEILQSL